MNDEESHYAIEEGNVQPFSMQQLLGTITGSHYGYSYQKTTTMDVEWAC